jgi:RNA polymerase sigma factor (sigma-70 family)
MHDAVDTEVHDRVAEAYEAYYDLLQFIAGHRFKIPAAEIRPLIHDVFVSFMRHEKAIGNDRQWLTAAVSNACRNYWRNLRPGFPLPEDLLDPQDTADKVIVQCDLAVVLDSLSEKCRSILRLRYLDGLDAGEIAARCGTSPGYIRLKVHRCLEAARRAWAELS